MITARSGGSGCGSAPRSIGSRSNTWQPDSGPSVFVCHSSGYSLRYPTTVFVQYDAGRTTAESFLERRDFDAYRRRFRS